MFFTASALVVFLVCSNGSVVIVVVLSHTKSSIFIIMTNSPLLPPGSLAAIALVDASNCYDRNAHAMTSLIFQSFGDEGIAVSEMLETIQKVTFFLRTAYEDSKEFAHLPNEIKTQGLSQGNCASSVEWCVISTMILQAIEQRGTGFTSWHLSHMFHRVCREL
jgi:hypothetical protein